jgi:hypothetical protein
MMNEDKSKGADQWCLPQLLQSDSVAQEKWLLLTENLCSVAPVGLWLGQKHLRVVLVN